LGNVMMGVRPKGIGYRSKAMSAITTRPRSPAAPSSSDGLGPGAGDQRIVIPGVGWHVYECLSEAIGEWQHIRLAYDGEDLEIMTAGYPHERYKDLLGKIVAAVTQALNIDRGTCGETTWKRAETNRGIQADLSYYFDAEKLRTERAARARKSDDIADYPNPDLAVEVDLSGPKVDRPSIYAALGVAEIWRFDGEKVVVEQLQQDGSYAPADSSRFLPIRAEDVRRWLVDEDSTYELVWERQLGEWARGLGSPA
jgi:Uma2 family endonuclease